LKSKNYRWRILTFLFFATTINYIDRQVIGILKPFIEKDPSIGFSEADYGYIVSAFQITYAIGLLLTGRFLDKFGTRIGYFWAVLVWSLAAILHAMATGFKSFALARAEELAFINQDDSDIVEDRNLRWSELLKYKQTYAICLTRFISDWVWGFFLFWIPDFLNKTQGINLSALVLPLIIIYSVSSLGGISGGWVSSKLIQSGKSINFSRKLSIFIYALLVLPLMLLSFVDNLWMAVLLIALACAGHQGWASNLFSVISDIYPKKAVGSMMGLSGFIGAIGAALSASFIGLFLEATNSYYYIFVLVSFIYLINWLIIKILIPTIKPIQV